MSHEFNVMTFGEFLALAQNKINVPNVLENSLFDGYFLDSSPVARFVRQKYLDLGFNYHLRNTRQEINAHMLTGFYYLPIMYAEKRIYYNQNIESIEMLVKNFPHFAKCPAKFIYPAPESSGNKLLHESVHFINFHEFFGDTYFNYNKEFTYKEQINWLLTHLTIESCVLAVEILSTLVAQTPENDCARYINCHQVARYPEDYNLILVKSFKTLGIKKTFYYLAMGYLAANIFTDADEVSPENSKILAKSELHHDIVFELTKRCMSLNKTFRSGSNSMYAFSIGFEDNYLELLKSIQYEDVVNHFKVHEIIDFNYQTIISKCFE